MCSGKVSSSCSSSGTRSVNLVTNPVISHEWGKDRKVFSTGGTYLWSFVIQIFHNGQPSHFRSDDFNLTNRKTWFSSFLVSSNPLSRKSWWERQALEYRINWEIYTPYAGAAGLLLHINGKFTMEKLKSSLLSYSFILNHPSLSISRCRSRYEADLSVSVVSFISSSMW
jgi:hypothetical protein